MAGFGDILHDHIGVWLGGYFGNLGDQSVLYAELHSIKRQRVIGGSGVKVIPYMIFNFSQQPSKCAFTNRQML